MSLCFPQSDAGWEEYYDYIFPEDAANQPNRKLLAMVKMWKKQMVETAAEDQEESTSADEHAAPTQTDTNGAAVEQKPEMTNDDRDESSSSGESDGEKESKPSQDAEKD